MGVKSLADDKYLNEPSDTDLLESSEIFEEEEQENQEEEDQEQQEEETSDDDQESSEEEEESTDDDQEEEQDDQEEDDQDQQEEEPEEQPAPKSKGKTNAVPASRFQKVIHERNSLREELEALKRQVSAAPKSEAPKAPEKSEPEFDFDAKEEEYADAILVGESKKAKEIRKQINEAYAKQMEERIVSKTISKVSQDKEVERFTGAVAALEQKYPFLKADSKQANKEAIEEVISFRDMYISKGHSLTEALFKAVERVVPLYAQADEAPKGGKKEVSERTKKSLEKATNTANKTPPRTSGVGVGNKGTVEKIDPSKLSIEAWEKLSQAEKDKLLG